MRFTWLNEPMTDKHYGTIIWYSRLLVPLHLKKTIGPRATPGLMLAIGIKRRQLLESLLMSRRFIKLWRHEYVDGWMDIWTEWMMVEDQGGLFNSSTDQ